MSIQVKGNRWAGPAPNEGLRQGRVLESMHVHIPSHAKRATYLERWHVKHEVCW